ncbi:glycoside hydrolase family 16 protein [Cerasicoccus fimbriatus]|uniref:glycoside hydrolase family 16 protein n=1 Tax=Cerasicoccus fimbriatus TaxID=3014554 RepID=UPI0022B3F873|nr:glycoside hydrolase family 16 protein [Cerasicoccus sp. TK19100]
MKCYLGFLTLLLLLVSGVQAEQTITLGDWAKVTAPTEYEQGVAFPVKVDVLKVDGPTKLVMNANWLKDSGAFGGFLQLLNINEDVTAPKSFEFNVTISKTKPNLKSVSLALYLSPDGEWKNKTVSGIVTLTPKAKQGTGHEAMEYEKITAEVKPFYMNTAPPVATLAEGGFADEPSFVDNFDPGWPNKSAWRVASWEQNGTLMSPERCYVDDSGNLVQTILKGGPPYLGGSLQSAREFGYGRWVARLKPTDVPGALNSMFTKDWDDLTTEKPDNDGTGFEIDIELLSYTFGKDKGAVHLAIHAKGFDNYLSINPTLDFNPSDDYHEWGFDVLPDRIIWHIDGKFLHEWKYTKEVYANEGYEMFFNSWTMPKWIHGPTQEDADYHIDWVKFYPLKK